MANVVKKTRKKMTVHREDYFCEDVGCTDHVGALPKDRKVGEEDVEEDMLVGWEAGLEVTEEGKEHIGGDNTQKEENCIETFQQEI